MSKDIRGQNYLVPEEDLVPVKAPAKPPKTTLTPTDYPIWRAIFDAGEEGLTTHEVAAKLKLPESKVPAIVKRLWLAGQVRWNGKRRALSHKGAHRLPVYVNAAE